MPEPLLKTVQRRCRRCDPNYSNVALGSVSLFFVFFFLLEPFFFSCGPCFRIDISFDLGLFADACISMLCSFISFGLSFPLIKREWLCLYAPVLRGMRTSRGCLRSRTAFMLALCSILFCFFISVSLLFANHFIVWASLNISLAFPSF